MKNHAVAAFVFLMIPLAAACTAADGGEEDDDTGEEKVSSVEQAATESCRTVSKSTLQQCWSKYCPSGYYAKSCTSTSIRCCRPY